MANILDYLDWREDLTLAQDPFNEVDNLILAELSFVDFGGIVPGPGEGRAVPLWKAAEAYFAKTEGRPIDMGVLVPNQIPELLRRAAASPRFRDMKLNRAISTTTPTTEKTTKNRRRFCMKRRLFFMVRPPGTAAA